MAGDPKVATAVIDMTVDMSKLRASVQQAKQIVTQATKQVSAAAKQAAAGAYDVVGDSGTYELNLRSQQAIAAQNRERLDIIRAERMALAERLRGEREITNLRAQTSGGGTHINRRQGQAVSVGGDLSNQDIAKRAALAASSFMALSAATSAMNGNFSQAGESIGLMLTLARRINPVVGVGVTLVSALAGMWLKARDAAKEAAEAAKKLRMEQAEALMDSRRLAFSLVSQSNLVGADERVQARAAAIEENKKTTRAIEELERKSGYDTLQTARDAADALLRTKLDHIDRVYFAEQRAVEKAAADRAEAEQAAHREELYRISREANAVEQRKIDEMARDEMEARRTRTRSIDSVVGGHGQSFAIGGAAREVRVEGQRKVIEILDDIRRGIQHRIAGTGAFAQ